MNPRPGRSFFFRVFLYSVLASLFVLDGKLTSQPVNVPQLNPQTYNWQQWQNQLQATYSVAGNSHNINSWDAIVLQSYGVLQSQWEAQVQAQISNVVSGVNTQDSFQSVQDYKNYVYDSLESQASSLLTQWQRDAEFAIQTQRDQFIDAYYGGNVATVTNLKNQFDAEFQSLLNGGKPTLNGGQSADTSLLTNNQQSLNALEQQWYSQFNSNLQNGLWNYEQALQSLNTNYQNLLAQINQTQAQYQAYLQQIQSYESSVKDQVNQTVMGYQQFLNGNDLFWNTATALKDTASGAAISAVCTSGNCTNYTYDTTANQFVSSCPSGDTCVQLLYDLTNATYVNPSCPATATSGCTTLATIHTSLNADGKAFQNLINNIETAITQGKTGLAIFDQTTSQMLSYPQSCLNTGEVCGQGWYDSTQQKFLTSATCPTGDTCYQAIVDSTNPAALTGQYFANSCPASDPNCVSCPSGSSGQDTCQIQTMEVSLVYAATTLSNFLQQEIANAQGQVALYQAGGSASVSVPNGYSDLPTVANPFATVSNVFSVTRQDFLNGNANSSGAVGLAWNIVKYVLGQETQAQFANYLENAYSASLSAGGSASCNPDTSSYYYNDSYRVNDYNPACLASWFGSLGPGSLITGINAADLTAFQDTRYQGNMAGGSNNWGVDPAYCHDWLGCYGNIFTGAPAIAGANQTFSSNRTIGQTPGTNFYDYWEDESGCYGWPLICGVGMVQWQEDGIAINLNYQVSNFNSGANATTWQNLATQLQSFAYNWDQNVLPSITNWTGQVSTFQAQYASWQLKEQTLLSQAQADYATGLQNLQNSETNWLSQMNQLQSKATADFASVNRKLQDSRNQADANLLAQELFGVLNPNSISSGTDLSQTPSSGIITSSLFANVSSGLQSTNAQGQYGNLNFNLLANFAGSLNQAMSGISNLTLLSSTNNALLNDRMSYMQQMANSLAQERTFTQNGQDQLLRDNGHLATKRGDDGKTYLTDQDGNYIQYCDPTSGVCGHETIDQFITSKCGNDLMSSVCSGYTTLKYANVHVDSNGNILMDQATYTGAADGQGDNVANYRFGQYNQHISVGPPPAFLLGHGGGVGNLFDTSNSYNEAGRISEVISASFNGVNNFFANSNYSNAILSKLAGYDALNSANETKASMSASDQAQKAGMVADFIESVFLGGMSTKQWIAHETHNMVQSLYATALVNTFHLSPEAASFLAGAYLDHEAYKSAEHHLQGLTGVRNVLQALGPLDPLMYMEGDLLYKLGGGIFRPDDMAAISQWRNDKTAVYGLLMTEYGKSQGWSPDVIQLASQLATDFARQNDAKTELGMRGQALSLGRLERSVAAMEASIEGPISEAIGFAAEAAARTLSNAHLISQREEKDFDKNLRSAINSVKLTDEKNAITQWHNDQIQAAEFATAQIGKQNGWSADEIAKMQQIVGSYMKHKEAQREFGETSAMFSLGRIEGQLRLAASNVEGPLAEIENALLKPGLEVFRDLHLISNGDYKKIEGNLRKDVDATKLREYKDDEKAWQQEKIELAKTSIEIYGNQAGWDPAYTKQMEQIVGDYLTREQAKAELRKLDAAKIVLTGGTSLLDKALFKGGLGVLEAKVYRGALTTFADVGKAFGLFSKSDVKSIYRQSKDWSDTVTGAALQAQSEVGMVNKSFLKQKARELFFDAIARSMDPNGSEQEVENFASLLRGYMDHREAKKQARQERVNEAAQAVELAASILITVASSGTASETLLETIASITNDIKNVATLATDGMSAMRIARAVAVVANIATQTIVGEEQGGTNGAIAGFLNGMISSVTMAGKIPYTGFVTWTSHRNADLLMGEDEQKGGWGGGAGFSVGDVTVGASFAPGSGVDVNVNYAGGLLPKGSFVGIDYNAGSGNYTLNGGYDVYSKGGNHYGLAMSASKDGQASVGAFYNYESGNRKIGTNGATINFSNSGNFDVSGQFRGTNVATMDFDTNTHRYKVQGNDNFINELSTNLIQEHAGENRQESIKPTAEAIGHVLSERGVIQESTVQKMVAEGHGEEVLAMYDKYKSDMIEKVGQKGWENILGESAKSIQEKYGVDISVNKGASAEGTLESLWSRVKSDALLALGVSDVGGARSTGSKSFEFDTCFVAGTLVYTKEGYKGIEKIQVGDWVLSHNEKTGQLSFQRVTETYIHDVPLVHKITYHNGIVVETTWNHPFYVKGSGWTQVKDLSPEDRSVTLASIQNSVILEGRNQGVAIGASLASLGGQASNTVAPSWSETYAGTIGIRKVEEIRRPEKVYNIEVEGNHSYFVTKSRVLVHNYTQQIQDILDGKGILTEDNSKLMGGIAGYDKSGSPIYEKSKATIADKLRALGKIEEFNYGGSKWEKTSGNSKDYVSFSTKSNPYGKPEELIFHKENGELKILQRQYHEGKWYEASSTNLDVLKQSVAGFKTDDASAMTYATNVLGERGAKGGKYDDGKPKVAIVRDPVTGEAKFSETATGRKSVEIQIPTGNPKEPLIGKLLMGDVARTQRETRGDYSEKGKPKMIIEYDLRDPKQREAYKRDANAAIGKDGGHLLDESICYVASYSTNERFADIPTGELARKIGYKAAEQGKRTSNLTAKDAKVMLKEFGLTVKENDIYEYKENKEGTNQSQLYDWVKNQIENGKTVNVPGDLDASYRKSQGKKAMGHWIEIVGFVDGPPGKRGYMVNDSWGDLTKHYSKEKGGQDGRLVFYPADDPTIADLAPSGGAYSITKDDGQPDGLPDKSQTPSKGFRKRNSNWFGDIGGGASKIWHWFTGGNQ
ncbi:TIGR04388 family protein [Leptospira fluminis]|uniref:TIGR04388 family protein n=1 Tax=Leptospira fluminis TaxID=2484979 RepID=UPI001FE88719|nr:TIGR04388 family protein [Leptospira fluminis]